MERTQRGAGKNRSPSSVAQRNGWIELADVTSLVRLMDENGLVELEIENAGSKVRLVRERAGARPAASPSPVEIAPPPAAPAPANDDRALESAKPIISPMVGTFYRSPSPDAPPF